MPPARDRDRTELFGGRAELDHVPAHDRREVHRLREPAERHFEVLLARLRRVDLARTAGHRPALGRPCHREHVQHVARLALRDRLGREVRRGRGPGHAAAPLRRPEVVRGAEVLVECVDVEVAHRARPGQTVDVRGFEAGVGDRPFGRFRADLASRPPRRLCICSLADTRDRHLAANRFELACVSPVGRVRHAPNLSNEASGPTW